jgi:hypothetical protein
MADDASLDDDAAFGGEQTAAAKRGTAAPERRVAVRSAPSPSGRRTGFPHGTQHLAGEALAATLIADASQQDFELVVVAAHTCSPRYFEPLVPKRGLNKRAFCSRVALLPDRRHAES